MLFFILPLIIFIYVWWDDYTFSRQMKDKRAVKIHLVGLVFTLSISLIPIYLINDYFLIRPPDFSWTSELNLIFYMAILLSGLISFGWYLFISWLDIYEKEKFIYIFLTFAMACGTTFLVYAIAPFWDAIGLQENKQLFNDILYVVFRIGATEEFVKIIPVLLMLLLSKQMDEPFDFILFGSVSALGFAFIENIQYLQSTNLTALSGRAFFASVSHMFDTGIICYSMAMARYKGKSMIKAFFIGFGIASLAHGFYDFWLIFDFSTLGMESSNFFWVTLLFFLVSIHLFAIMKNNLINISQYYHPEKNLDSVLNKTRLFNLLLFILFSGYSFIYILNDQSEANDFLVNSAYSYTFILVYLVLSFNSTNIIQGYVAPLGLNKGMVRPLFNQQPDYLGISATIKTPLRGKTSISKILPLRGKLIKRLVIDGDINWYLFQMEASAYSEEKHGCIVLKPAKNEFQILTGSPQYFKVGMVEIQKENQVSFLKDELKFMGIIILSPTKI